MSLTVDPTLRNLNDCGCCKGTTARTPVDITNLPGLTAVAYRVGTYAQFKQSMLARLSSSDLQALGNLTTRDDNDFTIALLDAWSTVADVLTFYQERIANEFYLRTATEQVSILNLARLIGYELRPGVAASTYLAFTLEDAQGAPQKATIDIGTKVQSIPGQGEQPQIFETIEKIEARAAWNAIKPRLTRRHPIASDMNTFFFDGITTGLNPGDGLLIIPDSGGDPVFSNVVPVFRRVVQVTPQPEQQNTVVQLQPLQSNAPSSASITMSPVLSAKDTISEVIRTLNPSPITSNYLNKTISSADLNAEAYIGNFKVKDIFDNILATQPPPPTVFAFRTRASIFGNNASDWRAMPDSVKKNYIISPPGKGTGLYAEYFNNIDPNATSPTAIRIDSQVAFDWKTSGSGSDPLPPGIIPDNFSARWTGFVQPKITGTYEFYTLSDDGVRLWVDGELIINNWTDHLHPTTKTGTITLVEGHLYDIKLEYYQKTGKAVIRLYWSSGSDPREIIPTSHLYTPDFYQHIDEWPGFTISSVGTPPDIYLDAVYPKIVPGSWLVLKNSTNAEPYIVSETTELSKSDFAITARVTRVTLDTPASTGFDQFGIRTTTVFAQSEELPLARKPVENPVVGGAQIELDGLVDGLSAGQTIIILGELDQNRGVYGCEVATISYIEQVLQVLKIDSYTRINLTTGLNNDYVRDTVTINANVAHATHGETVQEVLGSGDASQSFQSFTLRQQPLTYTSASTPSGRESTLQVRVNDLQWHEVPSLYGYGSRDRIFVSRTDGNGNTIVQFGDGKIGMRPRTGMQNVQSTYRKGIGVAGNVDANQLSMLMTRPLGVKSVINPLAANGGADGESLDDARRNAPLTVLTLDRIVSLQDFEDFTRAFAGIAKAMATWTWSGQIRGVFITVAGPAGGEIKSDSDIYKNLLSAMHIAGDPYIPIRVESYREALFRIAARVKVNPDYRSEQVLTAVEKSLRSHFSFDTRDFGQPVTLSEVMAVIQAVPGVQAVDVDKLYRYGEEAKLNSSLAAAMPQPGNDGTVSAAELLTLDPDPLDDLGVML